MTTANAESRLLSALWRQAAEKYPDVKFCEIAAAMCIEGYPDKNCPTVLVYRDEDIVKQVVTLGALKGLDTRLEGPLSPPPVVCILPWVLADAGDGEVPRH
jgi:hypothetical protein